MNAAFQIMKGLIGFKPRISPAVATLQIYSQMLGIRNPLGVAVVLPRAAHHSNDDNYQANHCADEHKCRQSEQSESHQQTWGW